VTIWLDNHLSPALAAWIASEFGEPCVQGPGRGLARAADKDVFAAARALTRAGEPLVEISARS
jgi:predicted nuclease of predicted toxin-antitoxin system